MKDATEEARQLAETWIRCWQEGRPDDIPLADDFVHESPFGRLEGRELYLATVKPMAAKNVSSLEILRTIGAPGEAVILYEVDSPKGRFQACDWVFVEHGTIKEIRAFYDATHLRE